MGIDLVVPVKPLDRAKSRLLGAADRGLGEPAAHAELVLAVVRDTVAAAIGTDTVRQVLVVTSDPRVGEVVRAEGARVIPDLPDRGLNAAYTHGADQLLAEDPRATVGALQADLPALRPAELAAALRAGAGRRSYCADHHRTGTTLLLAARGRPLRPAFGPDSAAAHHRSRALPITDPLPSLRRDVDTPDDLVAACELGLGKHTAVLVADRQLCQR